MVNRIGWIVLAAALSACTGATAEADCESLSGQEPWLVLHAEEYGVPCVVVGIHQDLQIWNKGTHSLSLEWQGELVEIPSDDHFAIGPIGGIVEPGVYSIESDPYRSPDIHVVDPVDTFSGRTEPTASAFGPIEIGMTLQEASEASDQTVVVDPDLAPGPECWLAVIAGDPYTPIFTVAGDGTEVSIVEFITTFYPSPGTVGSAAPVVPPLCG